MKSIMQEIHEQRDRQRTPLVDWEVSDLELCRKMRRPFEPHITMATEEEKAEIDRVLECGEGECKL